MRKLFIILLSVLSLTAFAQQKKVAVYVTGPESVEEATRQIVGSELVAAIVLNDEYSAVERTADFLKELNQEHDYQRSGSVDDQQIRELGKQFGVEQVCVANIMPYQEKFYIQARMLDVENATILATAREISTLATIDDVVTAAENVAVKLVGKNAEITYPEQYSQIRESSTPYMKPIAIDNRGEFTTITFKFCSLFDGQYAISPSCYVIDNNTGTKYSYIGVSGIGQEKQPKLIEAGVNTFTITTKKLPANISNISIYESNSYYWNDITLLPYGQKDYFEFEDNIDELHVAQAKQYLEKLKNNPSEKYRLKEDYNKVVARLEAIIHPTYTLKVVNNHVHSRRVYVDGKYVGEVAGFSSGRFRVPIELYQKVVLERVAYLLPSSKNVYRLDKQPKNNDEIKITLE